MAFPAYYVFFPIIILLNNIGDSISADDYQDSTNGSHEYENLTRTIRQTKDGCDIPSEPPYTKYRIAGKNEDYFRSYAENYKFLDIVCDNGYNIEPFAQNYSTCRNGKLNPPLTKCLRTCPSLTSVTSTNVNCIWNDPNGNNIHLQNCIHPVEGTTVYLSCNSFYEEPSIKKNPVRVCINGKWDPHIVVCYPLCGVKRPKAKTNIISGHNAELGDYPWQVGVYNSQKDLICGGSILDYRVVLSAAHCFTDYDGNIESQKSYYIAAGKYYREYNDDRDKLAQYSKVQQIYVPARYKGTNNLQGFDIAVVILEDPFRISLRVQPVCIELSEESPDLHLSINKIGIVTGWGYTREGSDLSEVLKEVQIPYVPYEECYSAVPINFRRYITYDKFCGGYLNNGTSVCAGDSGGGVIFKKFNSDQHFIKGIVSASPAIEGVCDSNQYSVFTSVDIYINFVRILLRYNEIRQIIECTLDDCSDNYPVNNTVRTEGCTNTNFFNCRFIGRKCKLPNFPRNGKYILNQNDIYEPGSYVQQNSLLSVTCESEFELSEDGAKESYCSHSGEWTHSLKDCDHKLGYCSYEGIYLKLGERLSVKSPGCDVSEIYCSSSDDGKTFNILKSCSVHNSGFEISLR